MRRWLFPAVLLLASITSGALAARPAPRPHAPPPRRDDALSVPVVSVRRVPAVLRRTIAEAHLAAGLDAALADPAIGGGREQSCLVVTHRGRTLYSRNPSIALLPASTLKLLTAVAVLSELEPDTTLITEVRVDRAATDGVIEGPIYLIGGGDPLLATTDYAASFKNQPQVFTPIERLADQLVAKGIRVIRGGVVGDDSRYDSQRAIPTWKSGYLRDGEVGPIGALAVNDGFAEWTPRKVASANPAEHAAGLFTELLRARGVTVEGGPRAGRVRSGSPSHLLSALPSRPVSEMVGEMLRESDNNTAEVLTKELGQRTGNATWAGGVAAIRAALSARQLPIGGFAAVDGSGLDRSDRATCALVLGAVLSSKGSGPVSDGLPVAGQTGTLAKRFLDQPAAGRLRAKTGSLDEVAALAGFMNLPEDLAPLAFALLANGLPRDVVGRALQERVAAVLAAYPDAPGLDVIAPAARG